MNKYVVYIDGVLQDKGQIEIDSSKLELHNGFKFSPEHKGQYNSDNLLERDYFLDESKPTEGSGFQELYFKTI